MCNGKFFTGRNDSALRASGAAPKRGFWGWLRGERGHCSMARVPTIAEEDAKRPNRERECLVGDRPRAGDGSQDYVVRRDHFGARPRTGGRSVGGGTAARSSRAPA